MTDDPELARTTCLVQAAQGGDRAALNSLFERYVPRVRRIVALRMGTPLRRFADLEDLAQEALLRVFENIDRFEHKSEACFRDWLARCVKNSISDQRRKEGAKKRGKGLVRRFGESGDLADYLYPAQEPTPSEVVRGGELEERLEAALLSLPEHYVEVIILRRLCEMSFREIAEQMGFAKEGNVRTLLSRALNKLEEALGHRGT